VQKGPRWWQLADRVWKRETSPIEKVRNHYSWTAYLVLHVQHQQFTSISTLRTIFEHCRILTAKSLRLRYVRCSSGKFIDFRSTNSEIARTPLEPSMIGRIKSLEAIFNNCHLIAFLDQSFVFVLTIFGPVVIGTQNKYKKRAMRKNELFGTLETGVSKTCSTFCCCCPVSSMVISYCRHLSFP
jgi:hypothetical protein